MHVLANNPVSQRRQLSASQGGFMIIEALIAILIFSLGILGMIAMGGVAIGAQSDARYRTDASRLTENLASQISIGVARKDDPKELADSLLEYAHQPSGTACGAFSGSASEKDLVTKWVAEVKTVGPGLPGLPGVTDESMQVKIDNSVAGFNKVEITVCWRDPTTAATTPMRRHTLVTYVN
jgi:type IV pilus assembly protein PilV